jgi:serine phosphatase RsbU (regulator of sigma subunit)
MSAIDDLLTFKRSAEHMSDELADLKKENAKLRLEANLRKSLANQLERQKKFANEARAELEEKHRNLISSLNYAARIQSAILPSEDAVEQAFPGSFIFWQPQHIVGGDAYFMRRRNNDSGAIFGVYDCTGHGVPGAFMTLLAERALDAGVEASKADDADTGHSRAGTILSHVDEFIRAEVNSDSRSSSNDGMDAFLLDYQPGGPSFYAAANFKVFAQLDDGFTELDSDEASIGYRKEEADPAPTYQTRQLDLSNAHCLVIVSDGILDQKGGPKGLSLGRRRLKMMLEQALVDDAGSSRLDSARLMTAIEEYQGEHEQRDDMTLIVLAL